MKYAYLGMVLGVFLTFATFGAGFPALGLFFAALTALNIYRIVKGKAQ